MAGLTVKVEDGKFQRKIGALQKGLVDATPLMEIWGEIAHASITENFEVGGRPPWQPLSPVTIGLKGHDRILIGRTGNLQRLTIKPGPQSVEIGTSPASRDYAAIQQFGGTINHPGGTPYFIDEKTGMAKFVSKEKAAGRNLPVTKAHKVTIPARPFIVLQEEDSEEMTVAARKYLRELAV